jgi:hypothetical protein
MSGLPPKHGLEVTVYSGPYPPHGSPKSATTTGQHGRSGSLRHTMDSAVDEERFTRSEIVSVRLPHRKPRRFSVLVWSQGRGPILIESVSISVCEEDEPVCDIPLSTSSVELEKAGDSQAFRPTDRQFAAIAEHLEHGNTVRITVQYLAAEQSELKISIVDKRCQHKLGYVLAMIGIGFAAPSILKHFPVRHSAPTT